MMLPSRWAGCLLALALTSGAAHALAQPSEANNPYRYDLRVGAFPLSFQAGISQSHFGSGARAEYDVTRRLTVQLSGDLPWWNVTGETSTHTFAVRAGLSVHFVDDAQLSPLSGTVYPEDTPVVGGPGPGTDTQMTVPVGQRMGGPRLRVANPDKNAKANMRNVQSIRLGYDGMRSVQRGRPYDENGDYHYFLNTLHSFYAGYGWGSHWNLSPVAGGGETRVGWRRFYVDAMVTLSGLDKATAVSKDEVVRQMQPDFFPLGLRVGMQGAIDALLSSAPGVGFGYSLEVGALPGKSGYEGYLMVALGVELDFATRGEGGAR
jgi:hypothetical protein